MSKTITGRSRSGSSETQRSERSEATHNRCLQDWLNSTEDSPTPAPPDLHTETTSKLIEIRHPNSEADSDYNWLVSYLTTDVQHHERIFRETVPKLDRNAVHAVLLFAVSDISSLTTQLDYKIASARKPDLKIEIPKKRMRENRDRSCELSLEDICNLEDYQKPEYFQAAKREIAWLRRESSNLEQVALDQDTAARSGSVEEYVYVPSDR